MNGEWRESKERSIRFASNDPEVFQIYIHWLYLHTLPVRIDLPGLAGNSEYVQLANAYVLGDMLLDTDFKDAVIDAIINKTRSTASDGQNWYPVGPVIRCIYENTRESSKARCLLVDLYVNYAEGYWLRELATWDDLPKEFLFDVANAALDRRQRPASYSIIDTCEYHEHTPEDPSLCYRKRLLSASTSLSVDTGKESAT